MKRLTHVLLFIQAFTAAQVPFMLKDINPGTAGTILGELYLRPNNEVLFYAGTSSATTTGVYRTDGSIPGTYLLRSFTFAGSFAEMGNHTYFAAQTPGYCLWRTNGQTWGTDSFPTIGVLSAGSLREVGSRIVFAATSGSGDQLLWSSDGSVTGTQTISPAVSAVSFYSVVNNVLLFAATTSSAGAEMWRTDGTAPGTYQLKDIRAGSASALGINPVKGAAAGRIFFIANDGITGDELYASDGTISGTQLLSDINPGAGSGFTSYNFYPAPHGMYFMASNPATGSELWFSDGTPGNTQMIKDVVAGPANGNPSPLIFTNGNAYYFYGSVNGQSILYKSDGSTAGTSSLAVCTHSTESMAINDTKLWLYNGSIYYTMVKYAVPNDSILLGKADLNLTSSVIDERVDYSPGAFMGYNFGTTTQFGSRLIYFPKNTNTSVLVFNLASSDHKIYHNYGASGQIFNNPLTHQPIGNKFYLPYQPAANQPAYLDLTTDSIKLLKTIMPGTPYVCSGGTGMLPWHYNLYVLNNKGYFLANEPGFGLEFFGTDLTPTGTSRILDINPGSGDFDNGTSQNLCPSYRIIQAPNNIYFMADNITNGLELWAMVTSSVAPPPNPTTFSDNTLNETKLFPNPSAGVFIVESTMDMKLMYVTDVTGARVAELPFSARRSEMDCSGFAAGVYFVTLEGDGWTKTLKLLIE